MRGAWEGPIEDDDFDPRRAYLEAAVTATKLPVETIEELFERLRKHIPDIQAKSTHDAAHGVRKVGIVCGSGGSMLGLVASRGCDAMLTGEATYHQCLEAESRGIAMLLIGHHASESFAMNRLAQHLQADLKEVLVCTSERETSHF